MQIENSTRGFFHTPFTHYCLIVPPGDVVWIYNTFDNNFGIENDFTKYLLGVVHNILMNISPSNISTNLFLLERFHKNY